MYFHVPLYIPRERTIPVLKDGVAIFVVAQVPIINKTSIVTYCVNINNSTIKNYSRGFQIKKYLTNLK